MRVSKHINRFRSREEGAALVEFALIVPIMLLAFFVIVEFARLFFSYQAAVQGVRDATRYMARTVDEAICEGEPSGFTSSFVTEDRDDGTSDPLGRYYRIVERNMQTEIAEVLPANVELRLVRSRYKCIAGDTATTFRTPIVPMAEVEAQFIITFPLVGILQVNGLPLIDPIDHVVNDQTRIYGT